jgi:hypothetical protein
MVYCIIDSIFIVQYKISLSDIDKIIIFSFDRHFYFSCTTNERTNARTCRQKIVNIYIECFNNEQEKEKRRINDADNKE